MADFKDIRAAIVSKLTDSVTKIQSGCVYGYDKFALDGMPAAVVVPSDNEADYGSTSSDKLVFVFKVRFYYDRTKESEEGAAETALEEVVDQALTAFKERNVLGSVCDWVEPIPSVWQYEERGETLYRVAEITLRCIKYIA
ncbi:MAG: hypothetical protein P1P85_04180 [Patescibacteria group bacterium]|nr:hypothetical protein [Patescibacteria group bacterium]